LLLVRALVGWAAAGCVLVSLSPFPLVVVLLLSAAGGLAAVSATALQAVAQCAWSEWSDD
jgi:hypothetical protein